MLEGDQKKRKLPNQSIAEPKQEEELDVEKLEDSPSKDSKKEQTDDDVEFMTSHLNHDVVIWSSNHKVNGE